MQRGEGSGDVVAHHGSAGEENGLGDDVHVPYLRKTKKSSSASKPCAQGTDMVDDESGSSGSGSSM